MFDTLTQWEIPQTATSTLSNADHVIAMAFDSNHAILTKRYSDQVGLLDPSNGQFTEFKLERSGGAALGIEYILPLRSRFGGARPRGILIACEQGIVYFNPRRQNAILIEIDKPARLDQLDESIFGGPGYKQGDWLARFQGTDRAIFADHNRRIWTAATTAPTAAFASPEPAICRWEWGVLRSRYVSVWRLGHRYNGLPYRFWQDAQRRVWYTANARSAPAGGPSFGVIDPDTADIRDWEMGSSGATSLGGVRDMGGIHGDHASETVWFSWPRYWRLFAFRDIYGPPTPFPAAEGYFHALSGASPAAPSPDFGEVHDLVPSGDGSFYFANDSDAYMGNLKDGAAPDEMRGLSETHTKDLPSLYEIRRETLRVRPVHSGPLTPVSQPVATLEDWEPEFIRWPLPGIGHHPTLDGDDLWFVKRNRTIAVLHR